MTETTNQSNGLATGGLVVGIVSIVAGFFSWPGILVGIVGLILSILGKKKATELNGVGKGAAQGGLITSIIGIVIGLVIMILAVMFVSAAAGAFEDQLQNVDFNQIMEDAQNNAH